MASRPQAPAEWADGQSAQTLKAKPSAAMIASGFDDRQPRAGHLNWLFSNLYEWARFKEANPNLPGGGLVGVTYRTARPYQGLPWPLPATNKRAALEVYRRVNRSLGDQGTQANRFSVPVAAGVASVRNLGGVASGNPPIQEADVEACSYRTDRCISSTYTVLVDPSRVSRSVGAAAANGGATYRFSANPSELYERRWPFIYSSPGPTYIDVTQAAPYRARPVIPRLNFRFPSQTPSGLRYYQNVRVRYLLDSSWRVLLFEGTAPPPQRSGPHFSDNSNWLIAMATGNEAAVVDVGSGLNLARINYMVMAPPQQSGAYSGFFIRSSAARGSRLQDGLQPSAVGDQPLPFAMSGYMYDPAGGGKAIVEIGPKPGASNTIAKTAFSQLEISPEAGIPGARLAAASAAFEDAETAGHKKFTWALASDPTLGGGAASFAFSLAGAGYPGYGLEEITAGAIIESLGGEDYLRFLPAAGLSDGDHILIRRK